MMRDGATAIEVKAWVHDVFNWALQRRLSKGVVDKYPEVHNYGRSPVREERHRLDARHDPLRPSHQGHTSAVVTGTVLGTRCLGGPR